MKGKKQSNLSKPSSPSFTVQQSELCPKNFIIFDKTENQNKMIMFSPVIGANQFVSPGFNTGPIESDQAYDYERSNETPLEDDSDDLNALLSLDIAGDDYDDDDDVSTASSVPEMGNCRKMKEMMERMREIVPGGKCMTTAGVLDEAVRYLKSLKVEVQKLGVRNTPDVFGSSSADGRY